MRFSYYLIVLFQFCYVAGLVGQNTVGTIQNTVDAYIGYTLFTNHKTTYLINNCGEVINQWVSDYVDGKSVYLLEDGSILRAGVLSNSEVNIPGIGGVIQKFDWNGTLTWEFVYSSNMLSQHHDIYPLPNGNVLILAVTKKTKAQAILAGRDPLLLDDEYLFNEQIIEVEQSGLNSGTIVWEWNIWDHLVQDYDINQENYNSISENPQLLDINFVGASQKKTNWLHFNSIQYNFRLDQILISSRQLNEIYIIDHSTTTAQAASHNGGLSGKGGDILYRWGNPVSYQQGLMEDQMLFGQHTPYWIPETFPDGGKIMIFNNGIGRPSEFSTVDIISPELDANDNYFLNGSVFGPLSFDWSYQSAIPENFYSRIMSGAQRLPNGNTLVCDSDSGYFFEINSNNEIVWEYVNPQKTNGEIMSQGDIPESNLVFRAYKYSTNYSAFEGKDLTPGNTIEFNGNSNTCLILDNKDQIAAEVIVYPNPSRDYVNVISNKSITHVEIFNALGHKVAYIKKDTAKIDLTKLSAGLFIIQVLIEDEILSAKIVKY